MRFVNARNDGYIDEIWGTTAGMIIVDRALAYRGKSNYIYDLGLGWKQMTGLPFVFVVWVSVSDKMTFLKTKLDLSFIIGIIEYARMIPISQNVGYDLKKYYRKISLTE